MNFTDGQIEAAARALFERDSHRSIGLARAEHVWPRVRREYRLYARAALDAAAPAADGQAAALSAPSQPEQGRLV